ncbi:putative disease resistance RPP13-like protein 1 isoform X3 [Quercus lobata]|uniref:putative disease resistance RPP13-like protein 1 isoform X3 n=1 Tax=Quercus lobata TaxID=97700 RepID=UPI001244BA8B|nr:putative disease resistance RPP13-like protein 1 isoform X3 [Quercus lobata]
MTELVYSIASNFIDKIGTHAFQEFCSAGGISEEMKKLELTMSIIQAVLLDAEEKQVKNRGLTVWLGQLKDVFHEATDVLDEFECETLRRHVVKKYGNTSNQMFLGDCSLRKGCSLCLKLPLFCQVFVEDSSKEKGFL